MTRRDPWDVLELAERAATVVDGQHEGELAELLAAADDVAPALAALSATDEQAALRLAGSLSAFWQDSGRVDEGRRATEALLADISQRDTGPYARALLVASELAFRQGDQDAAGGHARDAIELGQQSGDTGAVGLAHINLARVAYRAGDAEGIEREARRALAAAPDDLPTRRGALHMLAWAAYTAGDRRSARERFEDSIALRRELGDRFGVAVEEANVGDSPPRTASCRRPRRGSARRSASRTTSGAGISSSTCCHRSRRSRRALALMLTAPACSARPTRSRA